jgi:hypothetical protein
MTLFAAKVPAALMTVAPNQHRSLSVRTHHQNYLAKGVMRSVCTIRRTSNVSDRVPHGCNFIHFRVLCSHVTRQKAPMRTAYYCYTCSINAAGVRGVGCSCCLQYICYIPLAYVPRQTVVE